MNTLQSAIGSQRFANDCATSCCKRAKRARRLFNFNLRALREARVPEELTNSQIALLCDIGELDPVRADDAGKADLARLVSGGFVEPAPRQPGPAYRPTAKGVAFLGERGAGLNEA